MRRASVSVGARGGGTAADVERLGLGPPLGRAYHGGVGRLFPVGCVDHQGAFLRKTGIIATLVAAAILSVGAVSPASAQGLEPPPSFQTADRFGVDVISGTLNISSPTISVGDPANGGLSFTATWDSKVRGWRYSNWGEVKKELAKPDPYCFAFYTVVYMGA